MAGLGVDSNPVYRPRAEPRPVGMRLCTDLALLIPELPPSPGQRGCFGTALGFAGFTASCIRSLSFLSISSPLSVTGTNLFQSVHQHRPHRVINLRLLANDQRLHDRNLSTSRVRSGVRLSEISAPNAKGRAQCFKELGLIWPLYLPAGSGEQSDQTIWMFDACGPFWPCVATNETRWFSSRLL